MRILIVDDHEMLRRATRRILETRRDLECHEAESGSEAIQKAIEFKPDLIILDISMPEVSGFDVARQIKQHLPHAAILFFSIYDSGDQVETAKLLGEGMVPKNDAGTMLLKAVDALGRKQRFFPIIENESE
jgi:DNA-binding NarL/FixJ family response regulator